MADLIQSSAKSRLQTGIWILKLAFLFIGLISTVLLLKLSITYSLNLLFSILPRAWISFRSWLSPPYIYIFVNLIIVTIAASSSFQQKLSEKKKVPRRKTQTHFDVVSGENLPDSDEKQPVSAGFAFGETVESSPEAWSDISCVTDSDHCSPETVKEPLVLPRLAVKRTVDDKPSVTAHFAVGKGVKPLTGNQRSVKLSPSEKAPKSLGVAKPKKTDTLDATWKAITDGRSKPLTRQLRKSDTWDAPPRIEPQPSLTDRRELRKSETFSESSSVSSGSASSRGSGVRRERSLSQDELNRRVEAFIKKFNDEIRLERQKSYKNYMEMVNRGSY